jgi:ketol-acid reductoisomerase
MRYSISNTAEYGDYTCGPRVITEAAREGMRENLRRIQDGSFAKEFLLDMSDESHQVHFKAMRRMEAEQLLEKTGAEIRSMYSWNDEDKLVNN